jgi:DNA-binding transcriptional ArsR family regulator
MAALTTPEPDASQSALLADSEVIRDPEPLRHPHADEIELAAVLHALSDPMRLRIAVALAGGGEHNCKSIHVPVTKSTCTHHFKVLREAGVIRQRQLGTTRMNSLRRAELDRRFPGLLDAVLAGAAPEVILVGDQAPVPGAR